MSSTQFQIIPVSSDLTIRVTLKSHAFNLFTQPKEDLWTFDREGRIIGMYVNGVNYRRTLDNRFVKKSRITIDGEGYRNVDTITLKEAEELLRKGLDLLETVKEQLPGDFQEMVEKVSRYSMEELIKEGRKFSRIYLPITILPPDQYMALVLQITEGCNYNRCTFCNFYRDRPFRIKPITEVSEHITKVLNYLGKGMELRKSIFLADANALVTPQDRLIPVMQLINEKIPRRRVFSFIDVFTGTKKTKEDFAELKKLGLQRVYLGVESGSGELLELLNKPQLTEDVLQLAEDIKGGGVNLGIIFLVGAGGMKYHQSHLTESLELTRVLPLGKGDIIYLSEFYETNREYTLTLRQRGIPLPTRRDIRMMAKEFSKEIKVVVPRGVAVSVYDIQQFLY